MGNADQWLVDDGINKGFVLCKYLSQPTASEVRPLTAADSSSQLLLLDAVDGSVENKKSGSIVDEFDPLVASGHSGDSESLYVAQYPFAGGNVSMDGTIPLPFGQVVCVLRKSDLEGNSEWWKVQYKDNPAMVGFVPANYLTIFKS